VSTNNTPSKYFESPLHLQRAFVLMKVMRPTILLTALLAVSSLAHAAPKSPARPTSKVLAAPSLNIAAQNGTIHITPIFHASMQIEYRGQVIHVDPFSQGNYSKAKKADVILITHSHGDHFDKAALSRIAKDSTEFIAPESVTEQLKDTTAAKRAAIFTLRNGVAFTFTRDDTHTKFDMVIGTVPAYNLKRGPKAGQKFHPKGQFNGYVLTLGGKRIYIAGDTEFVPEMKNLKNIDVAFLPMNLPYTMTPQEAAQAAKAFKPKVAVPYHYRYPFNKPNQNPQQFATALKGSGVQVKRLKWYPGE
jgi:L-ascorbate metabolism protein UlaG (beta-lactamase superfamily)